jgi:hypothetical protein
LEIRDAANRDVVTVIEILSPSNKVVGSRGRASYQQKRREILDSPSHLIEIDLLRMGRPFFQRNRPCDYSVCESRVERRPKGRYWPILLVQALPTVGIPLRPADPEVPLDLQAVLSSAYDRAGYDLRIDYDAEPEPPLTGANAEWAKELLRKRVTG